TIVFDTGSPGQVWTVAFQPDGKHLLCGNGDGIQRWRLTDGKRVGKKTGMIVYAISVSMDHRWVVCGKSEGASVWDVELRKKVIDVEGKNFVAVVDISADSTRFATGTGSSGSGSDRQASVWSLTTGKRLVGPLKHDNYVNGIRFSPSGEHIATTSRLYAIRVFDSHNGNEIISIMTDIPAWGPATPLAWSNNGQQVFTTSSDNRIRCFDVSTGSRLADSQVLHDGDDSQVYSIVAAANGKFITTFTPHSISFLDTSTLTRIGPVVENSEEIRSISISSDCSRLATGRRDGKVVVRALRDVLPDLYGPF
ncbi:WD40-repeat-containing domain protein, partial [Lanmaoa asiatica]